VPNLTELLKQAITEGYNEAEDKQEFFNDIKDYMYRVLSPRNSQPIDNVRWVPVEQVQANDYNPNSVAGNEMRLLYTSISHDGYTQPVVTVFDAEINKYVIVDGFHRYTIMRRYEDIYKLNDGRLPIVVIDKNINDRMASTIRHNRARGKHSVAGMGKIVFDMLKNGATDEEICNEVGLEPEELARLKYVTGFAKLFENAQYGQAWETDRQLKIKKAFENGDPIPTARYK
jgi:ParB-like chromosome segregation protein Spo0J